MNNMVSITKDFGEGAVWGAILTPDMKVGVYSEMIMPCRRVATLDELPFEEEAQLWAMAARRGQLILDHPDRHAIRFVINDGPLSAQTIRQVHLHLCATESEETCPDLSIAFSELRLVFAESLDRNMPVANLDIESRLEDITSILRSGRQSLRDQNANITSFSIYSRYPVTKDNFSLPLIWNIEGWDDAHFSNASASNMVRCLSGSRASPDSTHSCRYDGFEQI